MIVSFKCMFKANNAYYGYLKGKTYLSVATQTQESIVVHNEKWKASTSRICTRWPLLLALAIQSISVLYELLYLCFVNVRESQRRQNSQEKYKQKNDLSSRNPVMSAPRLIFSGIAVMSEFGIPESDARISDNLLKIKKSRNFWKAHSKRLNILKIRPILVDLKWIWFVALSFDAEWKMNNAVIQL